MRLLLDTNALFWFATDAPELSSRAKIVLEAPESELYVSAVSAFEVTTKHRIGKWPEAGPLIAAFDEFVFSAGLRPLALTHRHALMAGAFSGHKDPFDRLLAAQSVLEGLSIVSRDRAFDSFGLQRLW